MWILEGKIQLKWTAILNSSYINLSTLLKYSFSWLLHLVNNRRAAGKRILKSSSIQLHPCLNWREKDYWEETQKILLIPRIKCNSAQ